MTDTKFALPKVCIISILFVDINAPKEKKNKADDGIYTERPNKLEYNQKIANKHIETIPYFPTSNLFNIGVKITTTIKSLKNHVGPRIGIP